MPKRAMRIALPLIIALFSPVVSIFHASLPIPIFLSFFISFLIFLTTYLTTKNYIYGIVASLLFTAWSWRIADINFVTQILISLLMITFLLLFYKTGEKYLLFLSGIFLFSIFTLSPILFLMSLICIFIYFLFFNKEKILDRLLTFIYGALWAFIIYLVVLLQIHYFKIFILSIKINFNNIFVLFPLNCSLLLPIISIIAIFLLIVRGRFFLIFLPLYTFFLLFASRSNHAPLGMLSFIGIPLGIILRFNINKTIRVIIFLCIAILVCVGLSNFSLY